MRRAPESNGLGLAGFVCSLVGLCSGGLLSPVGLILSLVALGRQPRGFAIAGVVLGLLGSCGIILSIVFLPLFLLGVLASAGVAGGVIAMLGPQLEAQFDMAMVSQAVAEYRDRTGALPLRLDEVDIRDSDMLTDPWGNTYVYELSDDAMTFTLRSMGPDGQDGTADDVEMEGAMPGSASGGGLGGATSP